MILEQLTLDDDDIRRTITSLGSILPPYIATFVTDPSVIRRLYIHRILHIVTPYVRDTVAVTRLLLCTLHPDEPALAQLPEHCQNDRQLLQTRPDKELQFVVRVHRRINGVCWLPLGRSESHEMAHPLWKKSHSLTVKWYQRFCDLWLGWGQDGYGTSDNTGMRVFLRLFAGYQEGIWKDGYRWMRISRRLRRMVLAKEKMYPRTPS